MQSNAHECVDCRKFTFHLIYRFVIVTSIRYILHFFRNEICIEFPSPSKLARMLLCIVYCSVVPATVAPYIVAVCNVTVFVYTYSSHRATEDTVV